MPGIKDALYNLVFQELQHKRLTNLTDADVQQFFDTFVSTAVSGSEDVPETLEKGRLYYDEEAKVLYIGQTDGSTQQLIAIDDILKAENYNDNDMLIKKTISSIEVWSSITKADVRGFRRYAALLSQFDSSPPTVFLIENTVGSTISPTRSSTGTYNIRFASNVFASTFNVLITPQVMSDFTQFYASIVGDMISDTYEVTANNVVVRSYSRLRIDPDDPPNLIGGGLSDNILKLTPFELIYTPPA